MRLRRLEPILRRALRGPCALPPGSRVLVAVSGGADSLALLLALRNLGREFDLSLHAAHLHHGLRGAAADADLAFVRERCARLGVPLAWARWNTRARMRRRALREFLAGAARRARAVAIATAHTADDQLETVLMRLLRGTGLAGLAGMRPRRGAWIKPLLEATRAEVEADLRAGREPWREDASNRSPAYLRNRVRHEAIPALLAALAPGRGAPAPGAHAALARRVARAAAEVGDAARQIERRARRVLPGLCRIQAGVFELDSRRTASYALAVRRALLRRLWATAAPEAPGLTHRHLEALARLIEGGRPGARVGLPGGRHAVRGPGGTVRLLAGAAAGTTARSGAREALSGRKGILTTSFPFPGGR